MRNRPREWLAVRSAAQAQGGEAWQEWLRAHPDDRPTPDELAAIAADRKRFKVAERDRRKAERELRLAAARLAHAADRAARRERRGGAADWKVGGGVPASGSPGLPAASESHSALPHSPLPHSPLPSGLPPISTGHEAADLALRYRRTNGHVALDEAARIAGALGVEVPHREVKRRNRNKGAQGGGGSENGSPPTSLESGSPGGVPSSGSVGGVPLPCGAHVPDPAIPGVGGKLDPLYIASWPDEFSELMAAREWVTTTNHPRERSDLRALFARDPAAWLALTGWTYRVKETGADGREKPAEVRDVPFAPWPVQVGSMRRMAACVQDGRDVVIRKSRDMGASWLVVGLAVWGWLFHGWQSLLVSRVEDNVDRTGDPDSLFWKVDYLVTTQPAWLLPCHMDMFRKGGALRQHMVLRHPSSGATIAGQASGAHIGRGGRRTFVLFDEFAALEDDDAAWRSASDTTSCRIALSTPIGFGTRYDKLVAEARGTGNPELIEMLYWQHPEKNRGAETRVDFDGTITGVTGGTYVWTPWLGDQLRKRDKVDLAQNVFAEAMGAGAAFFPSAAVTAHRREFGREPRRANWIKGRWVDSPTGRWRLWADVEVGSYAVGIDPAYGTGNHASAVAVVDAGTKSLVAMMVDANITPADLAAEVADVCRGAFRDSVVAWEVNGPGQSLQRDFEAQRFHRVWKPRREGKTTHGIVDRVGWVSSESTKRLLLGNLSRAVQQGEVIVPCTGTLDEMLAYVLDGNGRVIPGRLRDESTGARENHGDRVIALALAWLAIDDAPVPGQEQDDYAPGTAGDLLRHREVFG